MAIRQTPTSVFPGPAGTFRWKGLNWRVDTQGAPNGTPTTASNIVLNADGSVDFKINAQGGAELVSTAGGQGYGDYYIVTTTDLSQMPNRMIWGGHFPYDNTDPSQEFDNQEAGNWVGSGVTFDPHHWTQQTTEIRPTRVFGPSGAQFAVPAGNQGWCHVTKWRPGRVDYYMYRGLDTTAPLFYHGFSTTGIPVPKNTTLQYINLWGRNWSTSGSPGTFTVKVTDFAFIPAAIADAPPVVVEPEPEPEPPPTTPPTPTRPTLVVDDVNVPPGGTPTNPTLPPRSILDDLNVLPPGAPPVEPTVPAAPGGLVVSPRNGGLVLTWATPLASDKVTSYSVEMVDGTTTLRYSLGVATTAAIAGLSNGVTYTARVYAHNVTGRSGAATVSATPAALGAYLGEAPLLPVPVTGPPPLESVPSTVSSLVVAERTGGFEASWVAPTSPGTRVIDAYLVTISVSGQDIDGNPIELPNSYYLLRNTVTSASFGGLSPDVLYSVKVQAHSAAGYGPAAAAPLDLRLENLRPPTAPFLTPSAMAPLAYSTFAGEVGPIEEVPPWTPTPAAEPTVWAFMPGSFFHGLNFARVDPPVNASTPVPNDASPGGV